MIDTDVKRRKENRKKMNRADDILLRPRARRPRDREPGTPKGLLACLGITVFLALVGSLVGVLIYTTTRSRAVNPDPVETFFCPLVPGDTDAILMRDCSPFGLCLGDANQCVADAFAETTPGSGVFVNTNYEEETGTCGIDGANSGECEISDELFCLRDGEIGENTRITCIPTPTDPDEFVRCGAFANGGTDQPIVNGGQFCNQPFEAPGLCSESTGECFAEVFQSNDDIEASPSTVICPDVTGACDTNATPQTPCACLVTSGLCQRLGDIASLLDDATLTCTNLQTGEAEAPQFFDPRETPTPTPTPSPTGADDFENIVNEMQALEAVLDNGGVQASAKFAKQTLHNDPARLQTLDDALTWQEFESDRIANSGRTVLLTQKDFNSGTLRIRAPGRFLLSEDVVFAPNPDNFFQPTEAQRSNGDYPFLSGFILDFFAAITVESDFVLIDLQGHTLSASRGWHTKQAFGMLIQLGNAPFVAGDGPANFAHPFFGASNVVIRNGVLGFNQHHAIHGNPGENIYIHDIVCEQYHIAGIALNGVETALIERVELLGTNTELSVLGTWSQSHFLDRFLARAEGIDARATAAKARLALLVSQAFNDVQLTPTHEIDANEHPEAYELFANRDRLVDGNVYGLLFSNHGAAVEQFDADFQEEGSGYRIYVRDVTIRNIINSVQEFVVLMDEHDEPVLGPVGDTIAIHRMFDANGAPKAELDAITDAQFAYAAAYVHHGAAAGWHKGSLNVPQPIIDWYEAGADIAQFGDVVVQNGYRYARNTDAMFHVDKGATGIRVDSVSHAKFHNVVVDGVEARSPAGIATVFPGESGPIDVKTYTNTDYGHPAQTVARGYNGNRARGVLLAADRDVDMLTVDVRNVKSLTGVALNVDTFPHVEGLKLAKKLQ